MIKLLSLEKDHRIKSFCVTARVTYGWYLEKTRGAETNLSIQRKVIGGTKAYSTLREDLKRKCILPPLVLAVNCLNLPTRLSTLDDIISESEEAALLTELSAPLNSIEADKTYIIDGLQRTNAIRQTSLELSGKERENFLSQKLRIELWLNISFGALAYRMLLLNAGQRPMSIKNQVEILSMRLKEDLGDIPGIEILSSIEGRRRVKQGQFHLSNLSQAFQAWLQGQPNIDLRNAVLEQLLADSAIETLGASLSGHQDSEKTDAFREFIQWVIAIDHCLPAVHQDFLANETVLQGVAAAAGSAQRNEQMRQRMKSGFQQLLSDIHADPEKDSLGIQEFNDLRKGIETSRVNVGQATREMAYRAFQEFFMSNGSKPMQECWQFAAARP